MLTSLIAYMRRHGLLPLAPPQPVARIPVPSRVAAPIRMPAQARQRPEIDNRREWVPDGLTAMGRTTPDRHQGGQRLKGGVEPAMEGIPRDAFQRMPPAAASPGLLPVNPVNGEAEVEGPSGARVAGPAGAESVAGPRGPGSGHAAKLGPENKYPASCQGKDQDAGPSMTPSTRDAAAHLPGSAAHCGGELSDVPVQRAIGTAIKLGTGPEADGPRCAQGAEGCSIQSFQVIEGATERPKFSVVGPVDSPGTEVATMRETAGQRSRVPARIAARPDASQWSDDELLTLPEAAALFWPAGPITTNTLRTAGRDGVLAITKVAGKFFTTPMAIRRMGAEGTTAEADKTRPDEDYTAGLIQMKLAEAQRLGGGRPRSRRAAKRSVVPIASDDRF